MTGRYKAYPDYSNTGINWLPEMPSHWEVTKLKYIISSLESGVSVNATDYPKSGNEYGVLKTSCVYTREFRPQENKTVFQEEVVRLKCPIRKGAIIISRMNTPDLVGAAAYVNVADKDLYLPDRLWQTVFANESVQDSKFIHYFMYLKGFREQISNSAEGASSSMQNIAKEDFLAINLLLPSIEEQQKIANFLDHETAKIDTLITKQEKLIELLKEKRQAVISHAVTKGLNPQTPMKDSGVEWLGEVPDHWRVVKLSYFLKLLSGDGITSNQIEPEGKYPVMGGNGFRGYTSTYNCDGEYALIGRQGALCGNINVAKGKFFASEHAVVVYPYINFDLTYLSEFLRFMNLGQYSVSAAQPGISVERINGLKIAFPPQEEQERIGEFIQENVQKFEALSAKSQTMIEALKERKTALISAAVTGKIDVRDWQPQGVQG